MRGPETLLEIAVTFLPCVIVPKIFARWIVYVVRMVDYKIIGWRWQYSHPPHPTRGAVDV